VIPHQKVKIVTVLPGTKDILPEIESMIEIGAKIVTICPLNTEHSDFLVVYSENVLQNP
jgi:hypothetical protein